jgi:signal transduction histidine kinase
VSDSWRLYCSVQLCRNIDWLTVESPIHQFNDQLLPLFINFERITGPSMNVVSSLLNAGTGFALTPSAKRGVELSNAIGLILFTLSLFTGLSYFVWYSWNVVTFAIPLLGIAALLTVFLNSIGQINLSRAWISIGPPLLVTSLSIYSKQVYYDHQQELDYFTFRIVVLGSCVIPWIIFSLEEKAPLFVCAGIGISILLAHDPLHYVFGVPYQQDKLKVLNYYFTNVVVFITYWIVIGSLLFLKWVSEQNEDRNIDLINELNKANKALLERSAEIEAQSVEIQEQTDILYANQNQLIEANHLIEEQRKLLFNKNQSLESELIEKNTHLTEANTELIKHNNELRQFSYTVSHNLRGPVASLLGLLELLNPKQLQDNDRLIVDHIKTSTKNLDQIIKDLNKIIDIRHEIFKIRQKIDLESELEEIATMMKRELELNNVVLNKDVLTCRYIYSIKPMVNSIIYNLMSNAVKYRSSERQPVIDVSAKEDDRFYIIEVRDNGLGIDIKQNQESLFRLYKRFHFHTDGKGLGLYLVKLQCESLGGSIEVESEINRYSKFTVRLQKPVNIDRQLLYEAEHAEIFFDAKVNATGVIWKRNVTSEQYRIVFKKCLEFVHSYNTPNYISDMSNQGPITHEDQRWMFEDILPHAIENGLKKIAAVRPDITNPVVIDYLNGINENVKRLGAEQRFFTSIDDAFEWIRSENENATIQVRQ